MKVSPFFFFSYFAAVLCSQAQVVFRLNALPLKYTPELDTIFISGNFNEWNPRDTTFRFKRNAQNQLEVMVNSNLPSLSYKITRGNWTTVEVAANGQNIADRVSSNLPNSIVNLDVADWIDTKGSHTTSSNVQILTSQLWLSALKKYRRIWVCLPAEYPSQPAKRYPVMYFHDGQNVFDAATSFSGEWKVDEAMAQLESSSAWEPIITVGIDNGGADRLSELTPFRHPNYGGGNGENYADALVNDVKQLIDLKFRTKPDPSNTAVGGSSLGGVETLFMAYQYPNVFSKALIFSPSIWFSDSLRKFCIAQQQPISSRLYWVCGTNEGDADMIPDLNECYSDLLTAGMPASQMKKTIVSGGSHSEGFWASQVKEGMSWLFANVTSVKKNENQDPFIQISQRKNSLQIRNLKQGQSIELQIISIKGQVLRQAKYNAEFYEIDLPAPGIYFLKVQAANQFQAFKIFTHNGHL